MADIKIRKTAQETSFEANDINYLDTDLLKGLFGLGYNPNEEGKPGVPMPEEVYSPITASVHNARMIVPHLITPAMLREAREDGELERLLHPHDEIDIPIDTGGTVTVVCAYVEEDWARFVLKDCWDEGVMNEEATNKGGYYKSKGRKHVLEDILPHIDPEWRELFKPRHLTEIIDGERVEYDDLMWLPSATDVFGPPDGRWWNEEEDSFQLQIFQRERDRVKECGDQGTYPWWLRSVYASGTYPFCIVTAGGSAAYNYAYRSDGFAPGFDI